MKTGKEQNYHWILSGDEISDLDKIIIEFHKNYILHLTTFDSGPLYPDNEEIRAGWTSDGEIMISPSISKNLIIPLGVFSEWYLSENKLIFPENFERFVNYSGFNLSPEFEHTLKIRTKFWEQLIRINPETFVSIGDNEIVVSKNEKLIKYIAENV